MWILWLAIGVAAFLLVFSFLAMQIACRRYDAFVANLDKVLTRPIYRDCKKEILEGKAFLDAHPYEEIRIRSYDGLTLVGDFYPCENARGTILMFHGWRSAPLMDCGCAAPSYHHNRLNTLLVYQRAGQERGQVYDLRHPRAQRRPFVGQVVRRTLRKRRALAFNGTFHGRGKRADGLRRAL